MPRNASSEADPVHQTRVDRVEQDYFLTGLDGRKQRVGNAVEAARHRQALAARIVGDAGDTTDMFGHRLAQLPVALKWEVRIRSIVLDSAVRRVDGDSWRSKIGVEVLQPQYVRVVGGVGSVAYLVDTDPRDVPQPRNSHALTVSVAGRQQRRVVSRTNYLGLVMLADPRHDPGPPAVVLREAPDLWALEPGFVAGAGFEPATSGL